MCVCAPPHSGWPGDVPQDGLRLRQPQRRPVLLPGVRPPTEQPVPAPERPAHLRQRGHVGGELPAVPVPGEWGRIRIYTSNENLDRRNLDDAFIRSQLW